MLNKEVSNFSAFFPFSCLVRRIEWSTQQSTFFPKKYVVLKCSSHFYTKISWTVSQLGSQHSSGRLKISKPHKHTISCDIIDDRHYNLDFCCCCCCWVFVFVVGLLDPNTVYKNLLDFCWFQNLHPRKSGGFSGPQFHCREGICFRKQVDETVLWNHFSLRGNKTLVCKIRSC